MTFFALPAKEQGKTVYIKESVGKSLLKEACAADHFRDQLEHISKTVKYRLDNTGVEVSIMVANLSIEPFYRNEKWFQENYETLKNYVKQRDYIIGVVYERHKTDTGECTGSFNPRIIDEGNGDFPSIIIRIPLNAEVKDIYEALSHEVTHLLDYLIQKFTGYTTHNFYNRDMRENDLPQFAIAILYSLWSTTEFNAWKTIIPERRDTFFEAIMYNLQAANNDNNEEDWDLIRFYVGHTQSNRKIFNMSPIQFKKYFITTSFNLLKKMVRKYY